MNEIFQEYFKTTSANLWMNTIIPNINFTDPDYYDVYNPPYGQPGYTDYDYGDYNEGVGLYPPKKLSISQRVSKWFSGFKIPSSKVKSKNESIAVNNIKID